VESSDYEIQEDVQEVVQEVVQESDCGNHSYDRPNSPSSNFSISSDSESFLVSQSSLVDESPPAPVLEVAPVDYYSSFSQSTPSTPISSPASLDLDPDELAFLEGISLEDAPQSESALIAQLLIDEALDQELAVVNSLSIDSEAIPEYSSGLYTSVESIMNPVVDQADDRDREILHWQEASQLNPEDPDLLELFAVESFDRNDLGNEDEGLFMESFADLSDLPLSPNRLIKSEDDTLTEIPNDEEELEAVESDRPPEPEIESEIRFLDDGELLVETEAHIETNYPLNLDEAELMEMVWNQILDSGNHSASDYGNHSASDRSNSNEEPEIGEYTSQEVLDLEIQDALNEDFLARENANTYLETNLEHNGGDQNIANLQNNPSQQLFFPELLNPSQYRIPQATPIPLTEINSATWYLGIDFGTTSLGAVLLNQTTGELYPLYWQQGRNTGLALNNYSLPTGIYGNPQAPGEPPVIYSVGLGVPEDLTPDQLLYQNFKPYLDLGIPYWKEPSWQPILRLAQNQPLVSMHWLQRATQELFNALSSPTAATQQLRATGLEPEILVNILETIAGVVLNCPVKSSEAYRWNLREAVLGAQLVAQPEQVMFIEEAIAPFLAALQVRSTEEYRPTPLPWKGYTLVINSGASVTEFALVDSTQPRNLTYEDFGLWSFPYAGNALDQDIICQLLLNPVTKLLQNVYETDKLLLANDLELPTAGELQTTQRDRLHFWLQSSAWGQTLLIAAQNLKLHLQTKPEHRLALGTDQWLVQQQQYESLVVIPFLQQLNQQLNSFLSTTGVSEHSIHQVVCAGGTVSGSLLDEWLKIKLPGAVVIRQIGLPTSMTVAAGLASLPLHPQICNQAQQYSDYFLLMELLRILPLEGTDTPAPTYRLEEITQMLERRGINTRACSDRLLQILTGELPTGLIPQLNQNMWLTTASQQHPDYVALKSEKLFTKNEQHLYQPNLDQCRRLYNYMTTMLDKTQQRLEEPLIFDLGSSL